MHLEFQREITPRHFAELGRPYRLLQIEQQDLVAICSEFDRIFWPGRGSYEGQRPRHRVSLYSMRTSDLIAVIDVSFPINDLAFHPSEAKIAIGTGSYDGGFLFEGEAHLWDWKSGASHSLLGESREVVRCRFTEEGALTLLLRPRDEEEFRTPDPYQTYLGVVLEDLRPSTSVVPAKSSGDPRLADLLPDAPAKWGFTPPVADDDARHTLSDTHWEWLRNHGYSERRQIWDLLWLNAETFVAAHQACQAEVWHLEHGCQRAFHGDGHGVEIFPHTSSGCFVHVLQRADWTKRTPDLSSLYRLHEDTFRLEREFGHCCTFSSDAAGNILARDTGDFMRRERPRQDCLLNADGQKLIETDLGSFSSFNHSLRLNGGQQLYYLRGNPAADHRHKELWSMRPDAKTHRVIGWDAEETHMMSSLASFVRDDQILRACEVYGVAQAGRTAILELLSLPDGRSLWKTSTLGCFTALAVSQEMNCAVFSLTNGDVGLLELGSGQILAQFTLSLDGIATIATALAIRQDQLLVGTIDGRILLYRFSR